MISDWIWEENLRPFLEVTSWLAGYEFDDLDWDAVTVGLAEADRSDESFEYGLGSAALRLRGSYTVRFDLTAEAAIERGVEVAVMVMQTYRCTQTTA